MLQQHSLELKYNTKVVPSHPCTTTRSYHKQYNEPIYQKREQSDLPWAAHWIWNKLSSDWSWHKAAVQPIEILVIAIPPIVLAWVQQSTQLWRNNMVHGSNEKFHIGSRKTKIKRQFGQPILLNKQINKSQWLYYTATVSYGVNPFCKETGLPSFLKQIINFLTLKLRCKKGSPV